MSFFDLGTMQAALVLKDQGFTSGLGTAENAVSSVDKALLGMAAASAAAMAGVLKLTQETVDYADASIKMSRRTGMQVEKLTALHHAANLSGVAQQALNIGMQRFARRAAEAAQGTGEAKKALEEMGIQLKDNQGNLKTTDKLLLNVADAIQKLPPGADRTRLAFKLFDSEGVGMVNMLKDGAAGLKAMTDEAIALGLVIDTQTAEAAERWNDEITRLNGSMTGLVRQITTTIIKMADQVGIMTAITDGIKSLTKAWMDLDNDTKEYIITLGAVVLGLGLVGGAIVLIKLALPPLAAVWASTMGTMTTATALATGGISLLVAGLALVTAWGIKNRSRLENIFKPLEGALASVSSAVDDIKKSFIELVSAIPGSELLKEFVKSIGDTSAKATLLRGVMKGIAIYLRIGVGIFQIWLQAVKIVFQALIEVKNLVVAIWESIKKGSLKPLEKQWAKSLDKMKFKVGELKDVVVGVGKDVADIYSAQLRAAGRSGGGGGGGCPPGQVMKNGKCVKTGGGGGGGCKKGEVLQDGKCVKPGAAFDWKGLAGTIGGLHQQIIGDINSIYTAASDAALDHMRRSQEKMVWQVDAFNLIMDAKRDEELDSIRDFENARLALVEKGISDRMAALDAEWDATKKRLEKEYALTLESDAALLELKLKDIDENSVIDEERDTASAVARGDAQAIEELRARQHEERLREALKEHNDRVRDMEKNNRTIMGEERDASNKRVEEAEAAADKETIDRKRTLAMLLYAQSVAAFHKEKEQRIAQAWLQSAAGQIGAFVSGITSGIPYPYNLVAGGAAATAVLAASAQRITVMKAQNPPPPPPDLFFEKGGRIPGAGPVPITAHGKEFVLDEATTATVDRSDADRFQAKVRDRFEGGGETTTIVKFEEGAIAIHTDGPLDPDVVDEIAERIGPIVSEQLAAKIRQKGY